jgi:hypothetical protein
VRTDSDRSGSADRVSSGKNVANPQLPRSRSAASGLDSPAVMPPSTLQNRSDVHTLTIANDAFYGKRQPPVNSRGNPSGSGSAYSQVSTAPEFLRESMRDSTGNQHYDLTANWARDWAQAYANLVEANISAAAHLTGGADRDRELGELLAGFLASPLEVDP